MELKPDEFWKLTPVEFKELIQGYQTRLDVKKELLAWTQSNIMNVSIPKKQHRVSIDKLLGRQKKVMSKEEVAAKVIELQRRRKEG